MHVLLEDDQGRLILYRLRPWHQLAARFLADRLDHELARGARPEADPSLAARAIRLTSTNFRRGLAVSLQRLLAARSVPGAESALPMPAYSRGGLGGSPHVPVQQARISRSAPEIAELAGRLIAPGPVPARGVAMVTQLLADGGGPLYRRACHEDLRAIVEQATRALDQSAAS
jgi:hypothetical protein